MTFKIPTQAYTGTIRPVTLERGKRRVTVGGETAYPFYGFEGEMPNAPKIAIQVPDFRPDDWPDACLKPYEDVLGDPAAWARKAQDEYHADLILLWLKSTDPNGLDRSAEEAVKTVKAVLDTIRIPLIVWGTDSAEKDTEVLRAVAMTCAGTRICLGPVQEANHKQIGAQALAYNHIVVATSPIDVNLAKQLNILLGNLGIAADNLMIDPTVGGIGYGIEYTYSVMERIRQAALSQQDDKLAYPLLCNLADEVWKTKEARISDDAIMGRAGERGVLLEAITATTLLTAGADILVMRHPRAIQVVRNFIADITGTARPVEIVTAEEDSTPEPEAGVAVVSDLPPTMKLDIDIAAMMGGPVLVGPEHMLAVVRITQAEKGGITISPQAVEMFGSFLEAKEEARKPVEKEEAASSSEKREQKGKREEDQEPIEKTWEVPDDTVGELSVTFEAKKDFSGNEVRVVGAGYEAGKPAEKVDWRRNFKNKDEMVQYLKTGLRYWYSTQGYGSEKRKKPA
ncbi:MAG: acetyl-CoA decarbonylase/synthase complex subunit delta [Deltaproteobacteria bacterium]|nr:acetyl-CoA decarbonylase/synthase complex subunit delta [Deltaproteobacteria bacterium]